MTSTAPRRFYLDRTTDVTGVSGPGHVADGVLWPDGTVSIRWTGARPSVVFWQSLADAEFVHGHVGATQFVWLDPADDQPVTTPPDPSPYDTDPQAITWARGHILEAVAKAEAASSSPDLPAEDRERWRGTAYFMRHELLTEGKSVPGPFDERLPGWTERTAPGTTP